MDAQLLTSTARIDPALKDPEVAHLVINHNRVLGMNKVPGLEVEVEEIEEGIDALIRVKNNAVIQKPVHLCFGMLPESGVQKIILQIEVERNAAISILAHCIFPNAIDVKHIMDAKIHIQEGAHYTYLEKHIHSTSGGVKVYPRADVKLEEDARFSTDFELLEGRVGELFIDYETICRKNSVMDMTAKVNGRGDDIINIKEIGHLVGEGARGVLTSRVAVRERARAEVYNKLTATAPYARGHVDCKEIVQNEGLATATPIVEVNDPRAHVTHEAAIGSVDKKQLETLMARGLKEEEAVEIIIEGLLS